MECHKCGYTFKYNKEDIKFDENGYGYSTKYVICPRCKSICIVEYFEDRYLDVNNDERFYLY